MNKLFPLAAGILFTTVSFASANEIPKTNPEVKTEVVSPQMTPLARRQASNEEMKQQKILKEKKENDLKNRDNFRSDESIKSKIDYRHSGRGEFDRDGMREERYEGEGPLSIPGHILRGTARFADGALGYESCYWRWSPRFQHNVKVCP